MMPRNRKRVDAYDGLTKYLQNEFGITLTIYSQKTKPNDHEENNLDSITYQNKTVEIKDFYLASAVNYFKEYYGDVNQIVGYMSTTGNNNTLDEYVKTLGYSTVDEYVDSIYQINYGLKKDNVTFKKAKSIK